jgi:hypothetical protein
MRGFPQCGVDKTGLATIHRTQFTVNGPPVSFQRPRRDSQLPGNKLVGLAIAGSLQDFPLSF